MRSKTANGEEEEEAGVDRAELLVVSFGGEELIILEVGFDTVNVSVFVVPTELDGVAIEVLHKASAERPIFLLQGGWCERSAVVELAEIAEDPERPISTKEIEERVGAGLGVRGTAQRRLIAILASEIQDERAAGIPKCDVVAETKKQIAVAKIRSRGGKIGRCGKWIRAVDVEVGVVQLLGEMVTA